MPSPQAISSKPGPESTQTFPKLVAVLRDLHPRRQPTRKRFVRPSILVIADTFPKPRSDESLEELDMTFVVRPAPNSAHLLVAEIAVTDYQERALVRKLVEDMHLSVPERHSLPGGRARLSFVVDSISAVIRETGSFPAKADPHGAFHGAMAVTEGETFAVHYRYEVGMMRHATLRVERFARIEDAAMAVARSWGAEIDGIPIDEAG